MLRSMRAAMRRRSSIASSRRIPMSSDGARMSDAAPSRFYLPLNVELPNDFFSQFVVIAKDIEARERLRGKLERALAEHFPGAVTRTVPLELGPPVGWPVQYRVSGPDVNEVRDVALRLAQVVSSDSRPRRVNFDWMEPGRKVRIRVDQDQARLLGLSSQSIATVLNTV